MKKFNNNFSLSFLADIVNKFRRAKKSYFLYRLFPENTLNLRVNFEYSLQLGITKSQSSFFPPIRRLLLYFIYNLFFASSLCPSSLTQTIFFSFLYPPTFRKYFALQQRATSISMLYDDFFDVLVVLQD